MLSRRSLLAALPALGALTPAAAQTTSAAPPASGGQPPLVGRLYLAANRPWTPVLLQGQGPYRFIIDTGSNAAVIDPDLASQLKLARLDDTELQGATGRRTAPAYVAQEVVVAGALRQRGAVRFVGGDVGGGFAGILPAGLFTAVNSEIDFAAQEFRLYGARAPDRAGFVRLPLVRDPARPRDGRLVVRARLDGRPMDLLVDTGGAGSVLLSGEYVGFNRLFERYKRWTPIEGQGLLNPFAVRLVRARSLQLGPVQLKQPVVQLTDPFNPPGDAGDGVLGMDVLRRFTLATDPAGGALWLKPNAAFDEPFRYNRAGLETRFEDGAAVVKSVLTASPADRAGVEAGDRLPTVATPRDLAEFDWFLSEEPGTRLEFELQRGAERFMVSLVLQDLV